MWSGLVRGLAPLGCKKSVASRKEIANADAILGLSLEQLLKEDVPNSFSDEKNGWVVIRQFLDYSKKKQHDFTYRSVQHLWIVFPRVLRRVNQRVFRWLMLSGTARRLYLLFLDHSFMLAKTFTETLDQRFCRLIAKRDDLYTLFGRVDQQDSDQLLLRQCTSKFLRVQVGKFDFNSAESNSLDPLRSLQVQSSKLEFNSVESLRSLRLVFLLMPGESSFKKSSKRSKLIERIRRHAGHVFSHRADSITGSKSWGVSMSDVRQLYACELLWKEQLSEKWYDHRTFCKTIFPAFPNVSHPMFLLSSVANELMLSSIINTGPNLALCAVARWLIFMDA
jgi:hypothetical protein